MDATSQLTSRRSVSLMSSVPFKSMTFASMPAMSRMPRYKSGSSCMELKNHGPGAPGMVRAWSVMAMALRPFSAAESTISRMVLYACVDASECVCKSAMMLYMMIFSHFQLTLNAVKSL